VTPCKEPIEDEALVDWWAGERLPGTRELEAHLLGCGPCSARADELQRMAEGIAALLRAGELSVVVVPAVVDRLRRDGLRVREYAVPAGGGVQCTITPDDDLLLARLGAELLGVTRLDLVSRIEGAQEVRLTELPFDPRASELLLVPPVSAIRARPDFVERMTLVAVSAEGRERVVGRYEFRHTAWSAGRG
jgi:hypothetical protein